MKLSKSVSTMVSSVSARDCVNNTQKALLALLRAADSTSEGFVSRASMRIPNVGARIRSLRTAEFGGFTVECARGDRNTQGGYSTYYRLDPSSVTAEKVRMVFGDIVSTPRREDRTADRPADRSKRVQRTSR